jgi:hypothetical protein
MQSIHSLSPKSLGLISVCLLMTACSTFTSSDDDDTSGIFKSLRSPPRIGELKAPKSPIAVPAVSLKPTEPLSPGNAQSPKSAVAENNQAVANTAANSTPVAPPKTLSLQADESNVSPGPMLFAPYIPTLREGELPRRWQTQPTYDFPWVPGSLPTRINEETVVGYGEQMLGRLYAHAAFAEKAGASPAVTDTVQVKTLPATTPANKKSAKNAKTPDAASVTVTPIAPPASLKKTMQCEGGTTCLDLARDALVEDAKAKGWVMLLSRRVSLHNSFQFSRGERVIWIELNSNGKRDLDIEYTLLPIQSTTPRP